jgi:ABC-type nitrate/sulfonate/bicarbonate transport system permease component
MLTRVLWAILSIAVGFALVAVWQLGADLGLISPVFFPGPDRPWAALVAGLDSGELGPNIAATVQRMFYGCLVASVAAIALGLLIGACGRSCWRRCTGLPPWSRGSMKSAAPCVSAGGR